MDLHLGGKVAFVTGAAGGIGRETSLVLAQEGAAVAVADITTEGAQRTAEAVAATGGRAIACTVDVTSESSVAAALARAEAELGPVEILVNCAGIYRIGNLGDVPPEAWDELLDINLKGTYLTCRAVLPGMLARGSGSIVNLASISGRTKSTLAAPSYVASKAGVIGLTMSLASQSAGSGVRVNAVAPGPVDTEMIRGLPEALKPGLLGTIPMGRLGTAREVANAIVFLASGAAAFITGETVNINGGAFMV